MESIFCISRVLTKMGFHVCGGTYGSLEEGYAFPCIIMELPFNPKECLNQFGWIDTEMFDRILFEHTDPFDRLLTAYYKAYPLKDEDDEFQFSTDGRKLRLKPGSGTMQSNRTQSERAMKLVGYQKDLDQIAKYVE